MDWFDESTPTLLRLDLANDTGNWHLVAVFNWADEERDAAIPFARFGSSEGRYFAREILGWKFNPDFRGPAFSEGNSGSWSSSCSPLRPVMDGEPVYLGSDLHISQGLEVTQWSESPENFSLRLERPGNDRGAIDLYLPQPPSKVVIDQKEVNWEALGDHIYRIPVQFQQFSDIQIS